MASQKYPRGSVIWRHGKSYPATDYYRSISRDKFPGGRNYNKPLRSRRNRRMRTQDMECVDSLLTSMFLGVIFFFVFLVMMGWLIALLILLLLEFVIKIVILGLIKILNKKIKIFKANRFEKDMVGLITISFDKASNLSMLKPKKKSD